MEWKTENPKECGYYLAKWKYGRHSRRVSELWFDGRLWTSKREYLDGDYYQVDSFLGRELTDEVIAWMPKPKP